MTDLHTDAYQQFLCIEAGNAESDSRLLEPGAEHRLQKSIECII